MKKTEIFDRVYLQEPIHEAVFARYLESVCNEISKCYGEKYTAAEGEIPLADAYEEALVQGILYRHTGKECYEKAYRAATDRAYLAIWRDSERNKRKEE